MTSGEQRPLPAELEEASKAASRAFGEENRAHLLDQYFTAAGEITATNAWQHVYWLLLWVDRTIGLAHCYESDKCQPGRPWYARSLAFHDWVAAQLGTEPDALADQIDWLFRQAIKDLAQAAATLRQAKAEAAAQQRLPYEGRNLPEPGADPELAEIILETLGAWLPAEPPHEVVRELTERVTAHLTNENKRKNLVGEGFEDVLAALLRRVPGIAGSYSVYVRPWLHDLPGFRRPPRNQKPRQVDLALVRTGDGRRILVTAKWSIRSDREEQFATDFNDYARLEDLGEDFGYTLVTNEFDAARLAAACDNRRENAYLFTDVVHVNPEGPVVAYGDSTRGKAPVMRRQVAQGRIRSLADWLAALEAEGSSA